ncbi:MAG: hypothetical protein P8R42_18270 [Candidatus Binatia bacterium]|nr:hypothetical protein [Candidatus Binatia bacterium]
MPNRSLVASLWVLTWVLLQPPVRPDGTVVTGASLASWVVNGQFPTEKACNNSRSASQAALAYGLTESGGVAGNGAMVILGAKCMSMDQLKKLLAPPPVDVDP